MCQEPSASHWAPWEQLPLRPSLESRRCHGLTLLSTSVLILDLVLPYWSSMLSPDFAEFSRLSQQATLVPVAKTVAADLRTPVSAFLSIAASEPNAFLLESVEGGEKVGRYTFLGARPYMVLRARGTQITLEEGKKKRQVEGSLFQVLESLLQEHKPAH